MGPTGISTPQIALPVSASPAKTAASADFETLFVDSINHVEQQGAQAHHAVQQYLSGETEDLHKVAIASQRAELSTELFLQVRNKMISAYQEVMKMQM